MRRLLPPLALSACLLVPSVVFLGRYVVGGAAVAPAGSDTPQHVWRSNVVAELGLAALPAYAGSAQALNTNADRPGLPLLLSELSSVTRSEPRELVYVLPAVAAAAIAMAAAALAGSVPGMPWWGIGLAGVATGASVQVALAANGYLDELLILPLLLGAAGGALRAAAGGPGRGLGACCLVAAWLVHWQFAGVFTGLLVVLALGCLPESVRQRREGRSIPATATGRVAVMAGAGAGAGLVAVLAGVPGSLRLPLGLERSDVERHLGDQVALYRLPGGAAAAGLGAVSLAADRHPEARRAAWLLVPWALLPAAAALAYAAGRTVPTQRGLSFAVAIPLLGALGLVAAVRWLHGRFGTVAAAAGALIAAVALVVSVTLAWTAWRTREPWSEDRKLAEFRALAGYLTDADRPAVIVVDRPTGPFGRPGEHFGTVPVLRRIRAELPPRLALRTTVYLGDPERLVHGYRTIRPGTPGFEPISRQTWRSVRPLLSKDPVIVILRSQYRGYRDAVHAHPAWHAFPWIAIVSGPAPPAAFARPTGPPGPSAASLVTLWAGSFALISLVGIGWSGRFGGGGLAMRIAIAPAMGIAVLVIAALIAEHVGLRTGRAGGVAVAIGLALAGTIAAATARPGALVQERDRPPRRPGSA